MLPILAQLAAAATLAIPVGTPVMPALVAQIQQSEGHYHEGELGLAYLEIEQSLKCNCGCGLDVHSCQFQMQCGTSPAWSQEILADLENGMTPEAIRASFVAEYGPTVLMAPPPEGFNLVGYLLPSFALIGAGMLVLLLIRAGSSRQAEVATVREVSDEEQARLSAAMRSLEDEESPDW
ncbi:MAG TPA: cytochrome c-type biogenesis protein CcmH [Longimicrobiales bacterium]|nr:cytochrome c-type biogenesis protein CcmH [Longimicrobiales bacterium]